MSHVSEGQLCAIDRFRSRSPVGLVIRKARSTGTKWWVFHDGRTVLVDDSWLDPLPREEKEK